MIEDQQIEQVDNACCGVVEADTVIGAVNERYGNVAKQASEKQSNCCGVADVLYSAEELANLNDETQFASAGCGNPVGLSDVKVGETVLDLGSGGGVDCFLAAKAAGENGNIIGIDVTPEMVTLARENAKKIGVTNVTFKLGKLESLPQQDDSVDLVISNCVISLVERKELAFQEIFRVLKSGGRFVISDMVSDEPLPQDIRESMQEWVACIGGADSYERFLERIQTVGFVKIEVIDERLVSEKEFGSSHVKRQIKSITVKAFKP